MPSYHMLPYYGLILHDFGFLNPMGVTGQITKLPVAELLEHGGSTGQNDLRPSRNLRSDRGHISSEYITDTH